MVGVKDKLHRFGIILLAISLETAIAASGNAPNGFRGKAWGTQSTTGLKQYARASEKITVYTLLGSNKPQPLFGVPVRAATYSYSDGRLFNGIAYFSGEDNLLLFKNALTKEYGKPDIANDPQQLWSWKWPDRSVQIILYKGAVSYTNNSY